MEWQDRATDTVRNRHVVTPIIVSLSAVEIGLGGRFAHSPYDDLDQIFRDTSRRVDKRNPEAAILVTAE